MDATDRIIEEFDRLVALGPSGVAKCPIPERIVYYVVVTRCETDINGFASVYKQGLDPTELAILVDGLEQIGENELASEFRRVFELLKLNGYYDHMNWSTVLDSAKAEIELIGKRVGDRLWDLDAKLAALLDASGGRRTKG